MTTTQPTSETLQDVIGRLDRSDAGITFGGPAEHTVSYAELAKRIRGNAAHFRALGVHRGDRVAIALDNDPEHVIALLAMIACGAVPVSVKPHRGSVVDHAAMLRRICDRFGVRFAYHTLPRLDGIRSIGWNELASSSASVPGDVASPDELA